MDYLTFLETCPPLRWLGHRRGPAARDALRRGAEPGARADRARVLQLLNSAVAGLGPGECYLEVGTFQATLIGALLGTTGRRPRRWDDFSEFDPGGRNRESCGRTWPRTDWRTGCGSTTRHFEAFFRDRPASAAPVGVYLYDGAHDYRSQLLGLLLARPHLAQRALMVVDDANWPYVRQSVWDFLAARRRPELLLDLPTSSNGHGSFWNGLLVLAWDRTRLRRPRLARREAGVVESLYHLQPFFVRRSGIRRGWTLSRSENRRFR